MCLNENPSQSSNIVRPAIWVFTSCEVTYISMEHHQLRGGTFVRTSSITKVEANHSSTGIRSGSHLPGSLEMCYLPFTWHGQPALYRAWGWQLDVQTYPWCCWHCSPEQTKHVPAWKTSHTQIISITLLSILGWNGMLNILFVVHTKTVELAQDLHSLRHIPLSSPKEFLYKRKHKVNE